MGCFGIVVDSMRSFVLVVVIYGGFGGAARCERWIDGLPLLLGGESRILTEDSVW